MYDYDQILSCILDAGELLLTSGAEVSRVEDTIARMAKAYGFVRVDVLSILSSVVVSARLPNGKTLTQTRRITARDTNMQYVEAVNTLSRRVCGEPLPLEELRAQIERIATAPPPSTWQRAAAYVVIAAVFAGFFGGSLRDGIAAALCSLVLFAVCRLGTRIRLQPIILTMFSATIMTFSAQVTVWIGLGRSLDRIIIGNIMLLIPGLVLVSALRDMIMGDLISGLLGACEAILRALAIAVGCAIVLMWFGGGV